MRATEPARGQAVAAVSLSLLLSLSGCLGEPIGEGANQPAGSNASGQVPPAVPPTVTGPGADAVQAACKIRDPGPAPLRRLTRYEYDATVRDLLGDTSAPSSAFPPDERGAGFSNDAENLSVSSLHVESYMAAAEKLSVAATAPANLAKLVPCDAARGDAACAAKFIDVWGKRAWRRPLETDEKADLVKVFGDASAGGGFVAGVQTVMQVMLQSPQFLYRLETGAGEIGSGLNKMTKLSPWEAASRLSYLFWGSMPDDALFAEAEAGRLGTREEIAQQARRLIKDPKAQQTLAVFHEQWLGLEKIDQIDKDPAVFPNYDPALRALFRKETTLFLEEVLRNGDAKLGTVLTAPFSFMNAKLAAFYGIKGPSGPDWQKVSLDPKQRSGFLTQAGFLAAFALPNQTDPVRRGKFVREQFFCQQPPPPPNDIEVKPPDLAPGLSTRERFRQHAADPLCANCHRLMDPIGLAFEQYDGIGQWRQTDGGKPVDASGELIGTDIDGPFVGPLELGKKLAGSDQVRTCLVKHWFRFGYGRSETPADLCSIETLKALHAAGGDDVRELLIALTQTDAFLFRRSGSAGSPGGAP
jgi:hypothetical protein